MRSVLLLLATTATCGCQPTPTKLFSDAQRLAFAKKPAEALVAYEKVLLALGRDESEPTRAMRVKALRGAGDVCFLDLRDFKGALDYYRLLTDAYPEAPEALQARANLFEIRRNHFKDHRGAVAELAALVQSFPNHPGADRYQYQIAKEYFELGDYQQARIEAKSLLDKYPESKSCPDAQHLVASSWAFQGRRVDAINGYYMLIARWPTHSLASRARLEIGKLFSDAGDYDRAQETMLAALRDHPEPAAVQSELARLRRRLAMTRPADIHDHAAVWDWEFQPKGQVPASAP